MTQSVLALVFSTYANTFALPPGLLESVCYVESKHEVAAYHPADGHSPSIGVCQVKLDTARSMGFVGGETDLMEPTANVFFAAKYLRYQIDRYDSVERGVVAYNRGNATGLRDTQYSAKVMKQWRQ
jgi:hypothetical protein